MKRLILVLFLMMLSACNAGGEQIEFPKIDRRPAPLIFVRDTLDEMPTYNPESRNSFDVDLRSYDLSSLDLRNSLEDLMHSVFDDQTVWPADAQMPKEFDWQTMMEIGKNPGLGIRSLHEKGVTGQNVGIAIIDQKLFVDHQEYVDQLRLYEEVDEIVGGASSMHGAGVSSIAVGETVGVAPGADLYFFAASTGGPNRNFNTAWAIRRVLEINEILPEERKIRVISMSFAFSQKLEGYDELLLLVEEAMNEGLMLIASGQLHGFKYYGLGRTPYGEPDDYASYLPGSWWAENYYENPEHEFFIDNLMVPMDRRTTASPTGEKEYFYSSIGGISWSIPYLAGVYALAVQVEPEITPEGFWALALDTGRYIDIEHDGEIFHLGPIIDPVAIVEVLQND